jgi:hypothetical protein
MPLGILASLAMTKAYSMSQNHAAATSMQANLAVRWYFRCFVALCLMLFGDRIPLMAGLAWRFIIVSAIAATKGSGRHWHAYRRTH